VPIDEDYDREKRLGIEKAPAQSPFPQATREMPVVILYLIPSSLPYEARKFGVGHRDLTLCVWVCIAYAALASSIAYDSCLCSMPNIKI
jgi:hypothetical protein